MNISQCFFFLFFLSFFSYIQNEMCMKWMKDKRILDSHLLVYYTKHIFASFLCRDTRIMRLFECMCVCASVYHTIQMYLLVHCVHCVNVFNFCFCFSLFHRKRLWLHSMSLNCVCFVSYVNNAFFFSSHFIYLFVVFFFFTFGLFVDGFISNVLRRLIFEYKQRIHL